MKQLPLLIASCAAVALGAAPGPFAADAFAQARTQQAQAAAPAPQRGGAQRSDPFGGFGGNSKEPIRIDANKLEVFDKEQKAIYSGDVVAVRGTAVTRSTTMTIFYESKRGQNAEGGQRAAQPAAAQQRVVPPSPRLATPRRSSTMQLSTKGRSTARRNACAT